MNSAQMHVVQDLTPSAEMPVAALSVTAKSAAATSATATSGTATSGTAKSGAAKQEGLEQVLRNPAIWRAQQAHQAAPGISTGWRALDAILPDSGWPAAALTELLASVSGAGELSLLLPTLRAISASGKGIALLGAPYLPQARAWESAGIALERLLIIDAEGNDLLWAAEQVLRSGECGAVLLWSAAIGSRALNYRALQRLQLAASTGNALCFLYRPVAAETSPSPAPLRLRLAAQAGDLHLQVVKCRGAARVEAVRVQTFPKHWSSPLSTVPPFAASGGSAPDLAEAAKAPADARNPVTVQLTLV